MNLPSYHALGLLTGSWNARWERNVVRHIDLSSSTKVVRENRESNADLTRLDLTHAVGTEQADLALV